MDNEKLPPSRVVIELQDGSRFATAWSNRATESEALPLVHFFTGRLIARIIGSEDYITGHQIKRVLEEITTTPDRSELPRIIVQRRAPNITPQGRKLLSGAAKFVERLPGMSLERVDAILDNPDRVWDGWNGAKVHADHEFQVVLGQPWNGTDCVLSVSPDDGKQEGGAASASKDVAVDRRRSSGHKADRRRPVPNTVPDFLDRLKEYGFEVDDSRRHYSISHRNRPGVTYPVPRTPSDSQRWAMNQVADIRKRFGIDVREPLD